MNSRASTSLVNEAIAALSGVAHAIAINAKQIPTCPGLYAVAGSRRGLEQLGLESYDPELPIYVGKAEKSLRDRDVKVHFGIGGLGASSCTGRSTLRRSLAALLRERLELVPVPRSATEATVRAYGLTAAGDERLSEWMRDELRLCVWISSGTVPLASVERSVLRTMKPPLNLTHVGESRKELRALRAEMLAEARLLSGGPTTRR